MGPTRVLESPDTQNLPMWVRATAVVGIPGLIAIYLVWFLANALPARIEAHAAESRDSNARQVQLLIQICANTATTAEARAVCWSVRP